MFNVLCMFDVTNLSKLFSISFLQHFARTQLRLTGLCMTKHFTIQCNFGTSFSPSKDVQLNWWQLYILYSMTNFQNDTSIKTSPNLYTIHIHIIVYQTRV